MCNVTYEALFSHVKEGMGDVMLEADPDWLSHVRDFMTTIEGLGGRPMQFDAELFRFMSENGPEIEALKRKMEEVASATKAQGVRLQAAIAGDEEISAMGIGRPRVWSLDKYYLGCSTFFDVRLQGRKAQAHPEIANNVDKMQVRCWVNGPSAMAQV